MGTLGLGNGAVFQLVGLRYRERIGVADRPGRRGRRARRLLPADRPRARRATRFGSYGPGIGAIAAASPRVALCGDAGGPRGLELAPAGERAQ